ncbi:MAG: winged helix-turn-helix transcriptional regulator [Alphaproteobacteria bacterium]|nr:winged helix-turn-helix transcriptional regulator [Alphaproteobacteria bacterium SS10]
MDKVYKALAHPVRREILKLLREGDLSAGDLAARFELSASTMSGHFAQLKDANLINVDRKGTTLIYRVNLSVLEESMSALMAFFNLNEPSEEQQ